MPTLYTSKTEKSEVEKIVILSVLKPVDDVRTYKKIAKSLVEENRKITLIGFKGSLSSHAEKENIDFVELFDNKNRLGVWRFFAGFEVLIELVKIRPHKIIVSAVELLPFTLFYKFFSNTKLIYDVQENYAFNILYQDNYPKFLKRTLAFLVRGFEKISSSFIDLYLLAEQCYLEEIPFLKNKNYVFLENKFLIENEIKPSLYQQNFEQKKEIKFLLYGSFSKTYGTLEGILFFKKLEKALQKRGFSAHLMLAGYCSDKKYTEKIMETINNEPSISILNNSVLLPISHQILLQELQKTDFVILPYLFNKSTQNCIPTKFYECLAYQKPMLFSKNKRWEDFILPLYAGISIDFENVVAESELKIIVEKIISNYFYQNTIDEKVWKFDKSNLCLSL